MRKNVWFEKLISRKRHRFLLALLREKLLKKFKNHRSTLWRGKNMASNLKVACSLIALDQHCYLHETHAALLVIEIYCTSGTGTSAAGFNTDCLIYNTNDFIDWMTEVKCVVKASHHPRVLF